MKKITLLKMMGIVCLFAIGSTKIQAQVIAVLPTQKVVPADSSYLSDTISLGAIMPYYVHPYARIKHSSLYNPSGYKWTVSGTGATFNTASLTILSIGGTGTYYADTIVNFTFSAIGNVVISSMERSSPKFSVTSGCDGDQRDVNVNIINLPSIPTIAVADTAQGGCSATAPYTIKFKFTASTVKFPLYINYTIKAADIDGVTVGAPQTYMYQINKTTENIVIPQTQLDAVSGSSNAEARYVITLGEMWDRISSNATNRTALAVDASAVKASILILTKPKSGVVKHIKTL